MRGLKRRGGDQYKKLALFTGLFILLILLGNSTRRVYNKKEEAGLALVRMEQEIGDLEERESELRSEQAKLKTDEGIDFELRKKFNIAREGEGVAIIVDESPGQDEQSDSATRWQKIKSFFGSLFE